MKRIIIFLMVVLMATLVNTQVLFTLNGVKLQTKGDYLEIGISQNFKLETDITSFIIGNEKRNETYYPYFTFRVINPNFWIEEVNVTEQVNCTATDDNEIPETTCSEFTYKINRSRRIKYTLTFDRDITEEYIEGWDWHNINLGKDYSFDADFRCYFNNSKSDKNIVNYELIDKINTKKNQTDITIAFNFSGVEAGSIVRCEDPIYNVKKFYDEFADLSQWNNDALGNWFAESGIACSGVGCTGGGACTAGGSNMSISYDIDLSDCVNGTANVNWTASEIGTSDAEDCINRTYSLDGGVTWAVGEKVLCDDTALTSYGFKVPNTTYSKQFRWRFVCQNFQAAGEGAQIPMFNITCNATKAVVSNCGNLNTGNVQYDLRKNVNSTGTCFNVIANNVTVDCHGYQINYSTTANNAYGINNTAINYTTIRGCNITTISKTANSKGITFQYNSNFGNIFNNSFTSEGTDGILITRNIRNITIANNNIWGNSSNGINVAFNVSNISIYNNLIQGNDTLAISFVGSQSSLDNHYSEGNSIFNNTIISNDIIGIQLSLNLKYNNIYNNIITIQDSYVSGVVSGINLRHTSNNTIYNNNITTGIGVIGITLRQVWNNTLYNNLIISPNVGISINGTVVSTASPSSNNFFINNSIITNLTHILISANSTNNIFLNNSFNKSRVVFVPRSPENSVEINNITVQWYLQVNVSNASGQPIQAQVIINDSNSLNLLNTTLGSTGLSEVIIVTEYTQNGSVAWLGSDSCMTITERTNITCFAPLNISTNYTGYNTNASSIEMNRSRLVNLFLGIISGAPPPAPCDCPASGNYIISDGSSCAINTDCLVNGKCIVESGAIRVESGTLTCTKGCSKRMIIGNYFTRLVGGGKLICGKS